MNYECCILMVNVNYDNPLVIPTLVCGAPPPVCFRCVFLAVYLTLSIITCDSKRAEAPPSTNNI